MEPRIDLDNLLDLDFSKNHCVGKSLYLTAHDLHNEGKVSKEHLDFLKEEIRWTYVYFGGDKRIAPIPKEVSHLMMDIIVGREYRDQNELKLIYN